MAAASADEGWNLDLGAMATIWRGGCIIRARFLDRIREAYDAEPGLPNLMLAEFFAAALRDGPGSVAARRRTGRRARHPGPGVLLLARLLRRLPARDRSRVACSRACATCSERTPTSASTGPGASTSCGARTVARSRSDRRTPTQIAGTTIFVSHAENTERARSTISRSCFPTRSISRGNEPSPMIASSEFA